MALRSSAGSLRRKVEWLWGAACILSARVAFAKRLKRGMLGLVYRAIAQDVVVFLSGS